MVESEICERDKSSALLIHPDYQGRVTMSWFDPGYWGDKAAPVGSGGRGGAWFVDADGADLVLREYLRGGLAANVSRKTYAFTGEKNVRSFSEFRLLMRLVTMGLPVPKPVAAWYRKASPLHYQAAIMIERLVDASPLADLIGGLEDDGWYNLGEAIRRFHDAGVRHADLNCFNVLVRDGAFFLIDFDKGCIMPQEAAPRWKSANLDRFARSLRKVAGDEVQRRVWVSFMNGYNGSHTA